MKPFLVAPGVLLCDEFFKPHNALAVQVICEEAPPGQLVLTSGLRGVDLASLHSKGMAIDFDVVPLSNAELDKPEQGIEWACRVQARLGGDYDVLWHKVEGRGGYHLHCEYDPKRPPYSGGFYQRVADTAKLRTSHA